MTRGDLPHRRLRATFCSFVDLVSELKMPIEISQGPPSFCRGCGREGRDGVRLCGECGDELIPQGFCPVCDRYVRHPEGATCPKHDLELTAGPAPDKPPLCEEDGADWVTVGSFATSHEAEVRRLRLEAEGIPTFLDGSRMGVHAIYAVATGGIKIQVPRALVPEARVLLSQSWAAPDDPDEIDDGEESESPTPAHLPPFGLKEAAGIGAILAALVAYLIYRST